MLRMTKEEWEDYKNKQARGRLDKIQIAEDSTPPRPKVSKLELRFDQQLEQHKLPPHVRNYFFIAGRDLELDYAWPERLFAVEIQGMAHRIKGKFKRDIEKRAMAQMAGWTVLELDGEAIRSERGIIWTLALLAMRVENPWSAPLLRKSSEPCKGGYWYAGKPLSETTHEALCTICHKTAEHH